MFHTSPSLFKGLNGDAYADSLQRPVSMGKAGTAQHAWLTMSLNQQECCTSCLTGQWSQAETFEGITIYLESFLSDRGKFLPFILCYLCRAMVPKEANITNIFYLGNMQINMQAMPLLKCKPDTSSLDHAQCKLGLHIFSESQTLRKTLQSLHMLNISAQISIPDAKAKLYLAAAIQ